MELSKRETLRLEPVAGGVRVRNISEDVLTALFWQGKLSEIAYSCGVSLQKDLWMASILGPKAKNMEPSSRTGNHGGLPGSMLALARVNKSMRLIHERYGSKGVALVLSAAQDLPIRAHKALEACLMLLSGPSARRRTPLQDLKKLLASA